MIRCCWWPTLYFYWLYFIYFYYIKSSLCNAIGPERLYVYTELTFLPSDRNNTNIVSVCRPILLCHWNIRTWLTVSTGELHPVIICMLAIGFIINRNTVGSNVEPKWLSCCFWGCMKQAGKCALSHHSSSSSSSDALWALRAFFYCSS